MRTQWFLWCLSSPVLSCPVLSCPLLCTELWFYRIVSILFSSINRYHLNIYGVIFSVTSLPLTKCHHISSYAIMYHITLPPYDQKPSNPIKCSLILFYTTLFYIILSNPILYHTILYYTIQSYSIPHYSISYYPILLNFILSPPILFNSIPLWWNNKNSIPTSNSLLNMILIRTPSISMEDYDINCDSFAINSMVDCRLNHPYDD